MGIDRRRTRLFTLIMALAVIAAACSSSSTDEADDVDADATEAATASASAADADDDADTDTDEGEAENAGEGDETALSGFDAVTDTVESFVDSAGLEGAGLIVVHEDDGVIYEEYFGAFTEDRISMIASTSKMISAGVLLHLQDDGLLDVDAPVEEVVDWVGENPEITTAQLLSNSSGLVGLGPDLFYSPYLCQWAPADNLQRCGESVFTTSADDDDQIPPDSEFRYGGAQWQVAGAVAETVSGQSWADLIDEVYNEPCGLDSLGYISLGAIEFPESGYPIAFGGDPANATPSDNPNIEGGAYITVGDYGELLLMHLRGGTCGDTQVLSQEALDTMYADRVAAVYDGDATAADIGYGMGWWIDRDSGQITDPGAWGAIAWLDLDDRYGAYLIVEDEGATGQALKSQIDGFVHQGAVGA
ncbi:MAG: serine hydrolase domain-containing protein [Actinomycetota bacterium]